MFGNICYWLENWYIWTEMVDKSITEVIFVVNNWSYARVGQKGENKTGFPIITRRYQRGKHWGFLQFAFYLGTPSLPSHIYFLLVLLLLTSYLENGYFSWLTNDFS